MTERWRRGLAELDRNDPANDLWDRAVTRSREGFTHELHLRRPHRTLAVAVAALVTIAGLATVVNTFGPPKAGPTNPTPTPSVEEQTYHDPHGVWEISYPAAFHRGTLGNSDTPRVTVDGIWVANFEPEYLEPDDTHPINAPPHGVYVSIGQIFGGPFYVPSEPDSSFPLSVRDLQERVTLGFATYRGAVVANGERYFIHIAFGAEVSGDDRDEAERIVASMRVTPLQEGTATGRQTAFYVLGKPEEYAVGSVTRYDAGNLPRSPYGNPFSFYLVHVDAGFYALAFQPHLEHGYKDCEVTFEPASREFSCPNGALWALDGSVIERPPSSQVDDPLDVLLVRISLDDHVLVSPNLFGRDIARDLELT
jgi:hypothetical protein